MNRDEVMALTDAELRGWAWTLAYCNNPIRNMVNMDGEAEIDNATILVPDYPHDIAAAWTLASDAVDFAVYFPGSRGVDDIWCRMTLRDRECGERSGDFPGDLSAPRAITRAFVMVMASKEDGDES